GLERGNIWKSASRAHVSVEVEHGTESDSDAPRRSWLLRGRHWPLEAGISLLDHVHGLCGKISCIFRDDVASSLSLQQLTLNIIDLLDSIQDRQRRLDNFSADSVDRQYCDCVVASSLL